MSIVTELTPATTPVRSDSATKKVVVPTPTPPSATLVADVNAALTCAKLSFAVVVAPKAPDTKAVINELERTFGVSGFEEKTQRQNG